MDNLDPSNPTSRLGSFGLGLGALGALLCGVLIVWIVILAIRGTNLQSGDTGGAMGVGIAYVGMIPCAAVPVALICIVGATASGVALREKWSRAAGLGLLLSVAAPVMALISYVIGFAVLK
jgi:hypothetical protein